MKFTIRKARAADAGVLARIQAAWVKRFAPAHYSQRVVEAWTRHSVPEELVAVIKQREIEALVAVEEGKIAGFALLRGNEILSLHVIPPENEMEAGSALIARMVQSVELKGRRRLRVNAPLSQKRFYEANGFETIDKSIHTISDRISISCWEMVKWVTIDRGP